jgi:hypothetical protein
VVVAVCPAANDDVSAIESPRNRAPHASIARRGFTTSRVTRSTALFTLRRHVAQLVAA